MRKVTSILMFALLVLSMVTGIAESGESRAGAHIAISVIFAIVVLVHIGLNHKAFFRYFRKTGKNAIPERIAK